MKFSKLLALLALTTTMGISVNSNAEIPLSELEGKPCGDVGNDLSMLIKVKLTQVSAEARIKPELQVGVERVIGGLKLVTDMTRACVERERAKDLLAVKDIVGGMVNATNNIMNMPDRKNEGTKELDGVIFKTFDGSKRLISLDRRTSRLPVIQKFVADGFRALFDGVTKCKTEALLNTPNFPVCFKQTQDFAAGFVKEIGSEIIKAEIVTIEGLKSRIAGAQGFIKWFDSIVKQSQDSYNEAGKAYQLSLWFRAYGLNGHAKYYLDLCVYYLNLTRYFQGIAAQNAPRYNQAQIDLRALTEELRIITMLHERFVANN